MRLRHSRTSRRGYRAWLALAAMVASITAMVGIPLLAAPASASTDAWTASGPGTTTVLSDGADSNPSFSYWYCSVPSVPPLSSCTDGGAGEQTWTFEGSPTAGETQVTGTYLWTGDHAFCAPSAELQPFVVSNNVQTILPALVTEGNNCNQQDGLATDRWVVRVLRPVHVQPERGDAVRVLAQRVER